MREEVNEERFTVTTWSSFISEEFTRPDTKIQTMDNGSNKKIIEEICVYSEKIEAKDMLHEYMKR